MALSRAERDLPGTLCPVRPLVGLAFVLLLAALAFFGRGALPTRAALAGGERSTACTCELERGRNGWCQACGIGYAASFEIRSQVLYDALDLHGHDIDPGSLECEQCRTAVRADGFCAACKRGFLGARAYLSPLAYHLARGEDGAVSEELRVLALAIETARRCELCAGAMVLDGTCPECLLSYRGGRAQPVPRPGR